jgi:hypothetical protein
MPGTRPEESRAQGFEKSGSRHLDRHLDRHLEMKETGCSVRKDGGA